MKVILLNGKRMTEKARAHKYLKKKLNLPNYYGENLDALWDVLSTYSTPTKIIFINKEILITKLDEYGENLLQVLIDAAIDNDNINLEVRTHKN